MPQWLQALIDLLVLLGIVSCGGWFLYGLLSLFARHTSTARFWKSFAVATFAGATFVFCIGDQWNLPVWCATLVALVATFQALFFVCSVTLTQAALISVIFIPLMGCFHIGVEMAVDRAIPDRWTFAKQYHLAETEINRAINPNSPILKLRETLAILVDALVKLTNHGEAQTLETDVGTGLALLRERRMAATNREELVANQRAYEELRLELLGAPGITGTVTVAEIKTALATLHKQSASNEPVPDLDVAMSNLVQNLSSPEGMQSFLILGHTLSAVAREIDAMKSNTVLSSVANETAGTMTTSLTALAVGMLSPTGSTALLPVAGASPTSALASLARGPAVLMDGGTPGATPSTLRSEVAVKRGTKVTYVKPPPEMHISSVVSRNSKEGFVVCNGQIIRVGGFVSIVGQNSTMRFKLEAIEDATPRWSLVPNDPALVVIPFGRREK